MFKINLDELQYHQIHITDAGHHTILWTDFTDISCNRVRHTVSLNTAIQCFVLQVTVMQFSTFTIQKMCSGINFNLTCHCVTLTIRRCNTNRRGFVSRQLTSTTISRENRPDPGRLTGNLMKMQVKRLCEVYLNVENGHMGVC